ncbi:hypothetical protein GB931_18455 [Modestobacter sp. I12A-02628]|uniref:Lon proteolytic domain-containing protein n=1 Tax=Goekera deserti TaxID=2497753 RepID=A0A7K3W7Q0_9ACTN|nr:S16 family serine protease [Goekera deserti]MPQ99862.1 hypothetical protein [Goekera deserti]NDI50021.1 hypothetical protein [Goekera deserti]NEL52502.1 hypothetical protein [Goekera deserti]
MSRRIVVLVTGAVLLLTFGVLGTVLPVPYVAQVPGPTYNTLGSIDGDRIITVTGRETREVTGNLNLMTVGVTSGDLTIVEAVRGWFDQDTVVVPREAVYPADQTVEETQQQNRAQFLSSEQAAESAALSELGYPVKVVVQGFADESPSESVLEVGDAIEAVGGRPTPDQDTLKAVLGAVPPGTAVPVDYTRLGAPGTATVVTGTPPADDTGTVPAGSVLGVTVASLPSAPFTVSIDVADVGGPSAGLMLTLGILDLVGPTDLTGGEVIAGTGTIDAEGVVGPIGGIQLKLVAAHDIGAELFLVPAANCAEALAAPQPGITMAKVASLDDALTALADFGAGRTPAAC